MSRLKLSKTHSITHSITKSNLTGNYSLEDTSKGALEHVGTYTECLRIVKDIELRPAKYRHKVAHK